jgi:hypothetical protein
MAPLLPARRAFALASFRESDWAAILLLHFLWGSRSNAKVFRMAKNIDAAAGTPRPIRTLEMCPAGLLAHRSIADC